MFAVFFLIWGFGLRCCVGFVGACCCSVCVFFCGVGGFVVFCVLFVLVFLWFFAGFC